MSNADSTTRAVHACTIVARNYLPAARVLVRSFLEHHPGGAISVLVVDDAKEVVDDQKELFRVVRPRELDVDEIELLRMAALYDVTELCTALKPWLLRHLLDQGAPHVLYLDPDIEIFAPLDELSDLSEASGIVLTPHCEQPIPRDGREPSEQTILYSGAYNLGFIGIGASARPFLEWWQQRLARNCFREVDRAQFVDQRWVDLVPSLYNHVIVRDPGYNVAYWNLYDRHITETVEGYEVDGSPLRFFHFSGFQPSRPQLLFHYHHDEDRAPRALLSELPSVARLCREYTEKLRDAGSEDEQPEYLYDSLDDGTPIDDRMRKIYRQALEDFEAGTGIEPPNPFEAGDQFFRWLREASSPPIAPQVNRYLACVWDESPALRHEFPELEPETADAFLEWCSTVAATGHIRDDMLPTETELHARRQRRRRSRASGPWSRGVALVGYHGAVLGLGEVARGLSAALVAADVPVAAIGNPETKSLQLGDVATIEPADAAFDVNLFVVNADMMPPLAGQLGPGFFAGRRSVGLWFWEVDRFEAAPNKSLQVLDEVWAASDYTRRAVEAVTDKPVRVVPVPIPMPEPPAEIGRRELGLPEHDFVFLFTFDFFSVAERKNPWGLLDAYERAFDPDDGALLVLKSINGAQRMADLERLRLAAANRPDVVVWDEYLSRGHHAALLAASDAYASLHRSEGYGLTMGEAMALGKPVIATRYSGNLEFMNDDVSFLVDCEERLVGPGHHPYPADAHWAEPDIDDAAKQLRRVFEQRDVASAVGRRAAEHIHATRSVAAVAPVVSQLLEETRATPSDASWRWFFMRGWRPGMRGLVHRNYDLDWLPDGTPVDISAQALFDHALARARRGRGRPAPDPDAPGGSARVIRWLNEPFAPRIRPIVSRYLVQYWWDHPDLQERFPSIETDRKSAVAYVAWVTARWQEETDVPYPLVPTSRAKDA